MMRLRLGLFALLLALLAFGPAANAFSPNGLRNEATGYVDALRKAAPPEPKGEERKQAVKKAEQDGDAAFKAGDGPHAVEFYERAVALGGGQYGILMKLSRAWSLGATPSPQRAALAAYAAYQIPNLNAANVGAALWRLADLYDGPLNQPRQARAALWSILAKVKDDPKGNDALYPAQRDGLGRRLLELRRRLGLAVNGMEAQADQERPRICLAFDERLNADGKVRYEDFVALSPAPSEVIAELDGARLCLGGVSHGQIYQLTAREGLPGRDDVVLKKSVTATVIVPDRPATVSFRAGGRVLPKNGAQAVPFSAVNVDAVDVRIYRVNDRALTPFVQNDGMSDSYTSWQAHQLAEHQGELVWKGVLDVPMVANKEVTAGIPFAEAVPQPQPGYYAITIDPKGVDENRKPWGVATQWVLVSDIGVSSFAGADGLTVFARGLSTAKPLTGATVALVARNNTELGRAVTDAQGQVNFPPGLTRPAGGKTPHSVMVYAADGRDFAVLDLSQPAFDLSDRGVGGRAQPGPLDAYVYTDRGVYRQGETVNLTALLRDDRTLAAANFPLTVKVLRPSGTEYSSQTLTTGPAGAVAAPITLSATAPLGNWSVKVFADPGRPPVGSGRFLVEDFVPERLEVTLSPDATVIGGGDAPFGVTVKGRFLYGAPAVGLGGVAEMKVEADPAPYPGYADYAFGLVGETLNAQTETLEMEPADEQGITKLAVELGKLPDVSLPLRARFDVSLQEPGGRPAYATAFAAIRRQPFALGLRLADSGARLREGDAARVAVVALDRAGKPAAVKGASWTLIREQADFQWFMEDGRYHYRAVRHDQTVGSGKLDISAGSAPAMLDAGKPPVGRYRLEVAGGDGMPASKRFTVGWEPPDEPGDTPDTLDVTVDKPAYGAGEVARVKISPPFAGEALVTVATDRLHLTRTLSVGADGATIDIPVDAAAWGPGAYVTATVYRPPATSGARQPVRAVGVAWLAVDPSARSLKLALSAPTVARPRGPVEVTVKATDAAGAAPDDETYVTLAAVDEGILRLTRFASPDPGKHYFGKRQLGLDIRDDYGRLIAPFDGVMGKLRAGGDSSTPGLPALPFGLVSLFQGPVKLAADGTAKFRFDIPDFNGELRLMAVAFSGKRLGAAAQPLTVRDPLTAEAYFPRFLAPGDSSQATLSLHNVEAAAGRYVVSLTAAGGLKLPQETFTRELTLTKGQRDGFAVPLNAAAEGIGHVTLSVTGPGGFAVTRGYDLTIRSPRPMERRFFVQKIEPGWEIRLGGEQLAGFQPRGAALGASFGAAPPFDVAGILDSLYRYPYGCVEQTISTALPLLVVERLEKALGLPKPDQAAAARVQAAIGRLLDRQGFEGEFGAWNAISDVNAWLTAYAGEFLVRAQQAGRFVPEAPMARLMGWLEQHAVDGGTEPAALASRAYALHVLTLAGRATISPLRYFHDAFVDRLPTALARAQVAAALARFGDKTRATHAYGLAVGKLTRKADAANDYGSTLRDAAAVLRLGMETGLAQPHLDVLLAHMPAAEAGAGVSSTQEQAWLTLAAESLLAENAQPLKIRISGATTKGRDPITINPDAAQLAAGVTVANTGTTAIWHGLTLRGVPLEPPAAKAAGLVINRRFHHRDGRALDPTTVKQNDVFVVVLEGKSTAGVAHHLMLTQPLPAGWEIERAVTGESAGEEGPFGAWLGALSVTQMTEARDDRFSAAVDTIANAPLGDGELDKPVMFRVAFLARAITPGNYELPGALVEDMYQPRFRAQLDWGRGNVGAAQ